MREYIVQVMDNPLPTERKVVGEIVRCKYCTHHEDEEPGMVYCPAQVGGWVRENFFCADGERRDDG